MGKNTLVTEPNSKVTRTGKSLTKIDDPNYNFPENTSGISKFNIEIAQDMDLDKGSIIDGSPLTPNKKKIVEELRGIENLAETANGIINDAIRVKGE